MMEKKTKHYVVKILTDEDGAKRNHPAWCYVTPWGDSRRTFCTGEVFGFGEGAATYKDKMGYVTCPNCLSQIKQIQKIKL